MNYRDMNAGVRENREPILIRAAGGWDRATLLRLAALDSAAVPAGATLVAEVSGDVCTAIEVATGRVIADPFRRTDEIVALLNVRAAQVTLASVTSAEDARGRHDSPDRGPHARSARRQDHRAGRGSQPALAPSHPGV